jgi:HEAT repeat protein
MPLFGPPDVYKLKKKRDVEGLVKAMRHKDYITRGWAIQAIEEIATEPECSELLEDTTLRAQAVEAIVVALMDEKENRRQNAIDALKALKWKPGDGEAGAAYWASKGRWQKCVDIGPPAVGPLIAALRRKPSGVPVGGSADLQGSYVNKGAAKALCKIGEPVVEPLIDLLGDVSARWGPRALAAETLAEIGDQRAIEPIVAALEDEDMEVQQSAAEALGRIAKKVESEALRARLVELLISAFRAAYKRKRRSTLESVGAALGDIGDSRALQPLVDVLRDWPGGSEGARLGLIGIGKPAVEPLIAVLEDKRMSDMQRQAAAGALGMIGGSRAVEALERATSVYATRHVCLEMLKRLKGRGRKRSG